MVGIKDELKGQLPFALFILHTHCTQTETQVKEDIVRMVRSKIGAVACFHHAISVPRLPKTRSGKILRGVLRAIADEQVDVKVPATIEDISVLHEVKELILQYKQNK